LIVLLAWASVSFSARDTLYCDPGLQKVVQVTLVCKNLEASAKRWAEVLGLEVPKVTSHAQPSDGRDSASLAPKLQGM
jgi:hypothetical protein